MKGLCEIGGGYLVWLWLREKMRINFALVEESFYLFMELFQHFSIQFWSGIRIIWCGVFVVMAIIWGLLIDKKRPDRYEIIGGMIVLVGAAVIFYAPR